MATKMAWAVVGVGGRQAVRGGQVAAGVVLWVIGRCTWSEYLSIMYPAAHNFGWPSLFWNSPMRGKVCLAGDPPLHLPTFSVHVQAPSPASVLFSHVSV